MREAEQSKGGVSPWPALPADQRIPLVWHIFSHLLLRLLQVPGAILETLRQFPAMPDARWGSRDGISILLG